MNKITVAFLVLVLVVVGWFAYRQYQSPKTETPSSENWALSASMACADGSHFIAEFPTANEVQIIVDGNIIRTLPLVAGPGQRFENADYVYVFAGEEVNVTTKASGQTTACTQPNDPNNAPVNFGDRGEGAGAQQDATIAANSNIVGKWQSTEDAKFTREFKSNGTVVDMYDNGSVSNGTWASFTSASKKVTRATFPLEVGITYVQLAMTGSQADELNFKIIKLSPEELELVYMDRGNTLRFKKVD